MSSVAKSNKAERESRLFDGLEGFGMRLKIYYHAGIMGRDFRRMIKRGVLPRNIPVEALAELAMQAARTALAEKEYKRGKITKEAKYTELEKLDVITREALNMPLREFLLTCRYAIAL